MAICENCGAQKLTEHPCPGCGRGGLAHFRRAWFAEHGRGPDGNPNVPAQGGSANRAGDALAVEPPPLPMGQGIIGCEDVEAFFNMRQWLREALEAKGAKQVGAGIGMGQADIDIELEGQKFNVSIRPR